MYNLPLNSKEPVSKEPVFWNDFNLWDTATRYSRCGQKSYSIIFSRSSPSNHFSKRVLFRELVSTGQYNRYKCILYTGYFQVDFKRLPFDHCALSLQPFENPYADKVIRINVSDPDPLQETLIWIRVAKKIVIN